MTLAFKGDGGGRGLAVGGGQASLVVTTSVTAGAVGDLCVIGYAVDNNQTTDGDEGAVTSVTDSAGNTWVKAVEFTNGQGTAQTGATCGCWYSNLTAALAIGATITLNFSNSASRVAAACGVLFYTMGAGSFAAIEGTPGTLANDAAAAGSLNVTTANISCIRIRLIAAESNVTTVLIKTAAFDAVIVQRIADNAGTNLTSMGLRGEYLISTATGAASAPTGGTTVSDLASVYAAFKEVHVSSSAPLARPMRFFTRKF